MRIVPLIVVACGFACTHAQLLQPAPRVDTEPVSLVGDCAKQDRRLSAASAWEGEIRARYSIDERGTVHELRLHDFGDDAPQPVLRAVADSIGGCKFEPPGKNAPVQVTQFFEVGKQQPEFIGDAINRPGAPICATPRPVTPREARDLQITGKVLVSYVIDTDGRVLRVHLRNREAPEVLFASVREWLLSCRFAPATRDGQPVAVKVIHPFNFTFQ